MDEAPANVDVSFALWTFGQPILELVSPFFTGPDNWLGQHTNFWRKVSKYVAKGRVIIWAKSSMCLILRHFFLSGDCPDEDRAAMPRCVWRGLVKPQHLRQRGWRKRHLSGEFLTLNPSVDRLICQNISGWFWWTTGLSKRRPTRGAWSHVLGRRLCRTWLPWRVCRRFKYAVRNNYLRCLGAL